MGTDKRTPIKKKKKRKKQSFQETRVGLGETLIYMRHPWARITQLSFSQILDLEKLEKKYIFFKF